MIWIIVKKELLEHLMTLKFSIGMILCLVLVLLSFYVSVKDYERRLVDYQAAVQDQRDRGHRQNANRAKVYRKPEVLSIFSQGEDRKLGSLVEVRPGSVPFRASGYIGVSKSQYGGLMSKLGSMDWTFVIRVVMSLLALFLAYDTLSGENERGTLWLILSNAVPRDKLLLGKFIGGLLCLLIPLVMSLALGLIVIRSSLMVHLGIREWVRIGWIALGSMLYVTIFFSLGMLLSARTKAAYTTLLLSVMVWVGLLFIIPNLGILLAQYLKPVSSEEALMKKFEAIDINYLERLNRFLKSHSRGLETYEMRVQRNRERWKVEQDYLNQIYSQSNWARWLSSVSSGMTFSRLMNILAGTDIEPYKQFMRAVRAYGEQMTKLRNLRYTDQKAYNRQREDFPFFQYNREESVGEYLTRALPALVLLIFFNILFFLGTHVSFLRYEVG